MATTVEEAEKHPLLPSNLKFLRSQSDYRIDIGSHGEQMQELRFWTWGLLVYRCDYSDDSLWERYMAKLRDLTTTYHQEHFMEYTMHYLTWTIVEDKASLDGASKDLVREKFIEWRDGRSIKRDGLNAYNLNARTIPRFKYAIHVGKDSLDTMRAFEESQGQSVSRPIDVLVALVHAPWPLPAQYVRAQQQIDDDDSDEDELDDSGDDAESDNGWMYTPLIYWPGMYIEMVEMESSFWSCRYFPPPGKSGDRYSNF